MKTPNMEKLDSFTKVVMKGTSSGSGTRPGDASSASSQQGELGLFLFNSLRLGFQICKMKIKISSLRAL